MGTLFVDYQVRPDNDRFVNPETTFPSTGYTYWATREPGEPVAVPEAAGGAYSIWFQYTAAADALVSVRCPCTAQGDKLHSALVPDPRMC